MAKLRYQPTGWAHAYCYVIKWEPAQNKTRELYWKYYHATVPKEEEESAREVVVWRVQHAAMESAIKEHKNGFGVEKLPTQKFHANWAYLRIVQLAFNLVAWFKRLVLPASYQRSTVKMIRHHLTELGRQDRAYRPPLFLVDFRPVSLPSRLAVRDRLTGALTVWLMTYPWIQVVTTLCQSDFINLFLLSPSPQSRSWQSLALVPQMP